MSLRACIAFLALTWVAAPALSADKAQECRLQADIAQAMVDQRRAGASKRRAERRVTEGLPEAARKYELAVHALADDVYARPKAQLTEAYAEALFTQCMAFN